MAAALTVAVAVPAVALAQDPTAPPEKPPAPDYTVMIVKTTKSKESIGAKLGSYCLPNADGSGGSCHTATFPLPDPARVKVTKGEKLSLLFKVPVGYVTWRTARVNSKTKQEVAVSTGEAERVTRTKKRWRITLPKDLRKTATIVGVSVQYANAYSSFEFGIDVK